MFPRWFANQQHLYYGSFVLAVPIFCMIIEFMGVVTKDKALAKRYDQELVSCIGGDNARLVRVDGNAVS